MFEFFTNKGVSIDGQNLNVVCVRQIPLNISVNANPVAMRSFYHARTPVLIFDFEFGDIKTPVVGISLYAGIGYAQCSYIKDKQKRVRIWLAFNEDLIRNSFPRFKLPNNERELINYCTSFFKLTAYIYDTNPVPSQQNYGLEVYNAKGELVFDSNYRPMKIGINGDINNGKHIIFINRFLPFEWLIGDKIWVRDILSSSICNPLMVAFYQDICEYAQAFEKAGLKHDFHMPSSIERYYNDFIKYDALSPMIGYY